MRGISTRFFKTSPKKGWVNAGKFKGTVPTTLVKLVAKLFRPSLITVANLPPVSLIPVGILPPVSLIPVVHLDLRISLRIFEKNRKGPNGILWGWVETDS
jgi:hypothetical protein